MSYLSKAAAIPSADLDTLHRLLPGAAAGRAIALAKALCYFEASPDKASAAEEIRLSLEPLGLSGLSLKRLYAKAAAFRSGGVLAIIDGRATRRMHECRATTNREFVEFWHDLVTQNRRGTAAAYRELFRRLRAGMEIPGAGTWREIWADEHDGIAPDPEMLCPYQAYTQTPKGWSYPRLLRLKPDRFALLATRRGLMAATMEAAPTVPRTRVGLEPCAVVQIDDMWHEVAVTFGANRRAERVVEFSMIDVLTGAFLGWLTKPVVRRPGEEARETLRAKWVRYLLAHLLCEIGIPDGGCLIMGEHGTATVDAALRETLADLSGGRVRFGAGGRLSGPLGTGLYEGTPKGNPRYKGLLEGLHNLVKNELAALPGNIGGGRDRQPEEAYGMAKADALLRDLALALEERKPGLLERLALPFPLFSDFVSAVNTTYAILNARRSHELEGWEACGFTFPEYRLQPGAAWMPVSSLEKAPEQTRTAVLELIRARAAESRMQRMSPSEAFASVRGRLKPLPAYAAPLIMGPELCCRTVVGDRLEIDYREEYTGDRLKIAAQLDDGRLLERGSAVIVWVNPLNYKKAYICDASGRFFGTAKVMNAITYADSSSEAMAEALGVRSRALAAERARLAPIVRARQIRAAADAGQNAMEILGHDPATILTIQKTASRIGADEPLDRLAAAYNPDSEFSLSFE